MEVINSLDIVEYQAAGIGLSLLGQYKAFRGQACLSFLNQFWRSYSHLHEWKHFTDLTISPILYLQISLTLDYSISLGNILSQFGSNCWLHHYSWVTYQSEKYTDRVQSHCFYLHIKSCEILVNSTSKSGKN